MPIYAYKCTCGFEGDLMVTVENRDQAYCPVCLRSPQRQLAAPHFKFMGVVTKGGGPDKFTADMLGIPLHDLPSGLKTE